MRGIDVIDCSAGGMSGSVSLGTSKIRPGYQVDLAAAVRRGADIPAMAVGAIIEPRQAEAILVDGDADLVEQVDPTHGRVRRYGTSDQRDIDRRLFQCDK